MLEQISQVMDSLPPSRTRKRPWLAFVLGFLFSGIALSIYFRSWVDLVVPTAISLALIVLWWGSLVTGSAFFALVFDLAVIVVVLWQLRSGAGVSAQ